MEEEVIDREDAALARPVLLHSTAQRRGQADEGLYVSAVACRNRNSKAVHPHHTDTYRVQACSDHEPRKLQVGILYSWHDMSCTVALTFNSAD